jgi:hypothetical protein
MQLQKNKNVFKGGNTKFKCWKDTRLDTFKDHHHLLLLPWFRSFDLFRHRRVTTVSWGVHEREARLRETNWFSKNGGFAGGLVTLPPPPKENKVLISKDVHSKIISINPLSAHRLKMPWKFVICEEKLPGRIKNIWHRPRGNSYFKNTCWPSRMVLEYIYKSGRKKTYFGDKFNHWGRICNTFTLLNVLPSGKIK